MLVAFSLIPLAVIIHCLWVRRMTWYCRWEAATTLNIALQGCSLLLTSPMATATIGWWTLEATGLCNVEDFAGHLCCLVGLAALAHSAVSRLSLTQQQRHKFRVRAIGVSFAISVPTLTLAFVMAQDDFDRTAFDGHSGWLKIYAVVICGAYARLLWHLMRALLILRHDPRSPNVINVHLGSICLGFGACAAHLNIVFGTVVAVLPTNTAHVLASASACGFALASAMSWRKKLRWLSPGFADR